MPSVGQELLDSLYARVAASEKLAAILDGSFKFLLQGNGGGVWVFQGGESPSLQSGSLQSGKGEADCTITCSVSVLAGIIDGVVNPQVAYLEQDLVVEGDPTMALRLVNLWDA